MVDDYNAATQKLGELEEADTVFRPADQVTFAKQYTYRISKDYAALTAEEFKDFFGEPPSKLKVQEVTVEWRGPSKNKMKLFLVGMEGLPIEVMLSCRKARIEFSTGVGSEEFYLQPGDQLLKNQGQRVFAHCIESHNSSSSAVTK